MPILDFTLPPGVHPKHGRYYLIHKNKWHPLTRIDEGAIPFWRAYYKLTKADPEFMAGVFMAFLEEGLPEKVAAGELKAVTARKYEDYILIRLIPYCGHIHRSDINSSHCARYLDERKKAKAPIAGNRERAAWSTTNEWAMTKGWLTSNPCRGVRRNKERESLGYVEHEPLTAALDRAPPALYPLLSVAYVSGIRQTDLRLALDTQIVKVPRQVIDSDGRPKIIMAEILRVTESKTRKVNEHEITPTVRYLLDKAAAHKESVATRLEAAGAELLRLSQKRRAKSRLDRAAAIRADRHIFLSERGRPWTESGLGSALQRFQAGFQFRQLRPKAQTDRPEKDILGHTGQMRGRYTKKRKLSAVK